MLVAILIVMGFAFAILATLGLCAVAMAAQDLGDEDR